MNAQLASAIAGDAVFSLVADEGARGVAATKARPWVTYVLTDSIDGQVSQSYILTIEQEMDFMCRHITASAFSYDASHPSSFPIQTAAYNADWAGRGLSLRMSDTRSGRDFTSGEVPFEIFATPGYGCSLVKPFPFHYLFMRNTTIRFDIRCNDNVARKAANGLTSGHLFNIALHGHKIA